MERNLKLTLEVASKMYKNATNEIRIILENTFPELKKNTGIIYVPAMIDDCIFCSSEDKLINNLFKTLVWCIKEKHIEL